MTMTESQSRSVGIWSLGFGGHHVQIVEEGALYSSQVAEEN